MPPAGWCRDGCGWSSAARDGRTAWARFEQTPLPCPRLHAAAVPTSSPPCASGNATCELEVPAPWRLPSRATATAATPRDCESAACTSPGIASWGDWTQQYPAGPTRVPGQGESAALSGNARSRCVRLSAACATCGGADRHRAPSALHPGDAPVRWWSVARGPGGRGLQRRGCTRCSRSACPAPWLPPLRRTPPKRHTEGTCRSTRGRNTP